MKTPVDDVLDAVLGASDTAAPAPPIDDPEPATGLVTLRVEQLIPSENNPRERLTEIADLADSIRENGLIQPIIAQHQPGRGYVIVAGHRRHAAVQHLGWIHVEVIVRKAMRPDSELVAMLVENGQRAGLDPIEEARALQRLKAQMGGAPDTDVARRVGRNNTHVSNRLALLALPIEEQEQIRTGLMSLTEGNTRARISSGRVRPAAIGRAAPGHLTAAHALSRNAKARCVRLGHSRGKGVGVGGIACGECWESVIRADERQHIAEHSARVGECGICGSPYGTSDGQP